MHKASQSLIIGATILLGWLPMLAITVLLGINLFSSTDALQWHPWQGAGLAVLFVFCLLSLWATTSVAFGLSMQFFIRFVLLSVGALTLMVLNGFGWLQWWVTPSQSTQGLQLEKISSKLSQNSAVLANLKFVIFHKFANRAKLCRWFHLLGTCVAFIEQKFLKGPSGYYNSRKFRQNCRQIQPFWLI